VRKCRENHRRLFKRLGLLKPFAMMQLLDSIEMKMPSELTPSPTGRQMTGSGFAGLFGLFAGLCAVFAACATLSDWHDQSAQSRWPVVSAVVDRAEVVASSRAPKDGGGTVWKLRYRVRYELNGEQQAATVTSHPVFLEAEAARLQAWAAQHRKGDHIDVRVDPSRPNLAAFASAEASGSAERMHNDFVLLMIAAVVSTGLLALAKYLRAREALAGPATDSDSASRGGPAMALLFGAMGLLIVGLAIRSGINATDAVVKANAYLGVPAGLMFVFAGMLLALPTDSKWRSLLATLVVTCFALTFDWVAFGPGERRFSGSMMGVGFVSGEFWGRASFGVIAILLDIFAIKMWIDQFRHGLGLSPDPSTERDGRMTDSADSKASPAVPPRLAPDPSSAA
jgi:hypothetical protein